MTPNWNSTTTCSYSTLAGVVTGSTCTSTNDPVTINGSTSLQSYVTYSTSSSQSCGSASTTPCYNVITYLDFLFPTLVIIFLLSISVYGFFFAGYKRPIISSYH